MKITWKITKLRGIHRPSLEYTIQYTDAEVALNPEWPAVTSTIVAPDIDSQTCEDKRTSSKTERYLIIKTAPDNPYLSNKPRPLNAHISSGPLKWRKNNKYPEVEESLIKVRDAIERALIEAYNSAPMEEAGELVMTKKTANHLAPGFMEDKLGV